MLAGLLKAPSRFSPSSDPVLAKERTEVVLVAMADAEYIDEKTAKKEITRIGTGVMGRDTGALDRYFADWVINQIDSFISNNDRDLKVKTTFNIPLQKIAEAKGGSHLCPDEAGRKNFADGACDFG
jgi:penicillin-binding protein 1A